MSVIVASTQVRMDSWRSQRTASAIGALMGYDFHLGGAGPELIEIKTNAVDREDRSVP